MHSEVDKKGNLYVACSECDRGGNGAAKDKCSCGWKIKRYNKMGCYLGELMPQYQKDAEDAIMALHKKEAIV